MRLYSVATLTLVISCCVFGQQTYIINTFAGTGTQGYSGDNGPATSAELNQPYGVAVDSSANLYIADTPNSRIRKVSNGVITTVAGTGTQGYGGDNGPATSAELANPQGVAVDSAGALYIGDYNNNRVRKISNGVITTVAGTGTQGYSGDDGAAIYAQLDNPTGIAIDAAGNLYIADTNNHRIRKVSNGVITTVAGTGSQGYNGDNGPATSAKLASPQGVAVDSAGNLYIADTGNSCVREVSNGVITTVAGGLFLFGVALDAAGNLFIGDTNDNVIRKVSNGVITTVAGDGIFGYSGDGGPATSAELAFPHAVAVDAAGNVYVADTGNSRVRVLIPPRPPARLPLLRPLCFPPVQVGASPSPLRPALPAPGWFRPCQPGLPSPVVLLGPVPATSRSMWPQIPAYLVRQRLPSRAPRFQSRSRVLHPVPTLSASSAKPFRQRAGLGPSALSRPVVAPGPFSMR
jgi:sugar lactone lactonase YvrE